MPDGKKYAGSIDFVVASKLISDLNNFTILESYSSINKFLEQSDPPVTNFKIKDILKKTYYLKMNPYLDASNRGATWADLNFGFEGDKKKSTDVSVTVLDEIIKSFDKEGIDENYFKEIFVNDPSVAPRAYYLRSNLTKDELVKAKEFLLSSFSPPPDFPFRDLYQLPETDLKGFINLMESKERLELEDLLKSLKAF